MRAGGQEGKYAVRGRRGNFGKIWRKIAGLEGVWRRCEGESDSEGESWNRCIKAESTEKQRIR